MLITFNKPKRAIRRAHRKVSNYLNNLAKELPSIVSLVEYLEQLGCKGTQSSPCKCPLTCLISQFLEKEIKDFNFDVAILNDRCILKLTVGKRCHATKIDLPNVFHYFVELFDMGRYEQLVA